MDVVRRLGGSEVEFQRELCDPRVRDRAGDQAEGAGRRNTPPRRRKAWVVGEVEKLGPEVDILRFRDIELLAHAEIPVRETGRPIGAVARIAELPQWWKDKCVDIEPMG